MARQRRHHRRPAGRQHGRRPDPTQYTVSGYTQKPAAIMGDAVMILSNSWADINSFSSHQRAHRHADHVQRGHRLRRGPDHGNSQPAAARTISRASSKTGAGKNFTYHGSMCELYASPHFTGTYGKGNVYSAPNRRWFFDTIS